MLKGHHAFDSRWLRLYQQRNHQQSSQVSEDVCGYGSRETPWDDHQRRLNLERLLVFFTPHVLETSTGFRVQAMNAVFALLLSSHCLWLLIQTLLFSPFKRSRSDFGITYRGWISIVEFLFSCCFGGFGFPQHILIGNKAIVWVFWNFGWLAGVSGSKVMIWSNKKYCLIS